PFQAGQPNAFGAFGGMPGGPPAGAAPPMAGEPKAAPKELGALKDDADKVIKKLPGANNPLNFQEGVATAAVSTELGDYFQYLIEQPVSLPRQKSAMIPIINQPVEASRVSIYNQEVHTKYPLLGLRFKNATKLHLMQGPVTVFDNSSYAGDGRIGD